MYGKRRQNIGRIMYAMKSKIRDEKLDFLFRGILTLETIEDCYNFFEDLCTVSELQEMSRRMHAARMLNSNHIYADIAEQTGLSTATISRVNRCLKYGSDGYLSVLEKIEKKRRQKQSRDGRKRHIMRRQQKKAHHKG